MWNNEWFEVLCLYESMWSDSMQMLISGTVIEYQIAMGDFFFEGYAVFSLILAAAGGGV